MEEEAGGGMDGGGGGGNDVIGLRPVDRYGHFGAILRSNTRQNAELTDRPPARPCTIALLTPLAARMRILQRAREQWHGWHASVAIGSAAHRSVPQLAPLPPPPNDRCEPSMAKAASCSAVDSKAKHALSLVHKRRRSYSFSVRGISRVHAL
jgi:hypothetical protein